MIEAGAAPERPALWGGHFGPVASLLLGLIVPAMLPRHASPQSQIWASQLDRLFHDGLGIREQSETAVQAFKPKGPLNN